MNKVIYKYPVRGFRTRISLPRGYEIRHLGEQDGDIQVWIEINKTVVRNNDLFLEVYPTGQYFNEEGLKFLKTVQLQDGTVWHIFERIS